MKIAISTRPAHASECTRDFPASDTVVEVKLQGGDLPFASPAMTRSTAIELSARIARELVGEDIAAVELNGAHASGCAHCGKPTDWPTAIVCGLRADTGSC